MRTRPARLTIALAVLLGVFILAGVGALGAYLVLSQRSAGGAPAGPLTEWAPAADIRPELALLVLVSWPEQAVIDRALVEGEPDTALAVLAYATTLSDRARGGALLRVADAYAGGERAGVARALYWKAATVAALSPDLADQTRAELLLQASLGLLGVNQKKEALSLLDQATIVARESGSLQPAQRQQLAISLAEGYRRAGAEASARSLDLRRPTETVRSPAVLPAIALGAGVSTTLDETRPTSLQQAQAARRQAAAALVEVLSAQAGPPRPALVADVANALLDEDAAVAALRSCSDCAPLLAAEAAVSWTSLKRQAGSGRFGLSLLTQWEMAGSETDAAAQEAWSSLLDARGAAIGNARPPAGSEVDVLRGELLAGALGLLPQFDMAAGFARLQEAIQALGEPTTGWRLEMVAAGTDVRFVVIQAP